jgi:hypothetical protein
MNLLKHVVFWWPLLFIVFSFGAWSFNPALWHVISRTIFCVLIIFMPLVTRIISVAINEMMEERKAGKRL